MNIVDATLKRERYPLTVVIDLVQVSLLASIQCLFGFP